MSEPGWERFRAELAAELETLADETAVADEIAVVVDVAQALGPTAVQAQKSWLSRLRPKRTEGGHPYVQFAANDETLRMEVSSNEFLAPQHQLDQGAVGILERLGWSPPNAIESPNFFIDRPLAQAPELVGIAVQTLSEVFGVTDAAALQIRRV
ncbi:MAG: hypothetical protein H0U28_01535 [Nocardioidaceae bacterium]|nr:hypothetical protein [Nocardioidaceae bacterium]